MNSNKIILWEYEIDKTTIRNSNDRGIPCSLCGKTIRRSKYQIDREGITAVKWRTFVEVSPLRTSEFYNKDFPWSQWMYFDSQKCQKAFSFNVLLKHGKNVRVMQDLIPPCSVKIT